MRSQRAEHWRRDALIKTIRRVVRTTAFAKSFCVLALVPYPSRPSLWTILSAAARGLSDR